MLKRYRKNSVLSVYYFSVCLKGDSGGPMQIGTGNTWTQIGIVSWGIGCGKSHYPGVYTRVTEVKDWIDKIRKEY